MTAHDLRVTLTEADKALLDEKCPSGEDTEGWEYALLHRTVEQIVAEHVAARLAPIWALLDRWHVERYPDTGDPGWNQGWDTRRESDEIELRATLDAPQDAPRGPVGGEQGAEVAGGRSEGRGLVEACQWVCDGCTKTLTFSEVADWADGEHVLCESCNQPDGACFR